MELPSIKTETPRWDLAPQIRRYLPRSAPVILNPTEEDMMVVYRALCARDRAIVYRVALSLAEHASEYCHA